MPEATDHVRRPAAPLNLSVIALSLRRALRLQLDPAGVLPGEQQMLAAARPPVLSASAQAFQVWRRSLLLLIALAMVPALVLKAVGLIHGTDGTSGDPRNDLAAL
ncbi:MAG: hypothetical protein AAGC55_21935, partial [Myxococcota bacterium]